MKKIIIIILLIILPKFFHAQTIIIGEGASIYVGVNADICAGSYGNITGNIYGEGTQCGQLPLPVELSSLTALVNNNAVTLNWKTETEVNNYGFEVERKCKNDWQEIGFVKGNGNSNSLKEYSYTDNNPIGGCKFYYRLKQLDINGKYEYSKEIEVEVIPLNLALYQNYPNPFNPTTQIKYQLPKESRVEIKVYNILGAEVMTLLDAQKEPGIYEVTLNAMNLPSGIYIYRIIAGTFSEVKKMVLMK